MFTMDELNLYVTVVEAQGISASADRLGLPKSNVSRRLKLLEESLGVKLIERSSRVFRLTGAGRRFYAGSLEMLQRAEQLTEEVTRRQVSPSGRLRVCGPSAITHWLLKNGLNEFCAAYPEVELEFLSGGHKRGMLEEDIDLLIQINRPKDSSLVAVPLMKTTINFYASPGYLATHGHPKQPQELVEHRCVGSLNQDLERMPWRYLRRGKIKTLSVTHSHYSDSGPIAREMAEQGMGVALLPDFVCTDAVESGRLVRVFGGKYQSLDEIYLLYSGRHLLPGKTRAFIDFLQNRYRLTIGNMTRSTDRH
jgi:DNA-binding transcriptional LysR family regulator